MHPQRTMPVPYPAPWLVAARARNRAFVDDLNTRTVCTHCGAQPVEWHNPEHVELKRPHMRISQMVTHGAPLRSIGAEMARCTPLCRRCHMAEDGRLKVFVGSRVVVAEQAVKPCSECSRLDKPLRKGLCSRCYDRRRYRRRSGQVE